MAYPLIFAIYVYLFGFKWLRKHSNYVTGFWMVFAGLLLEFHAYLFSLDRMSGLDIFPGTKDLLFGELVSVQVARLRVVVCWGSSVPTDFLPLFKYR